MWRTDDQKRIIKKYQNIQKRKISWDWPVNCQILHFFFWNDRKDLLLSSINFALEYGRLSTEQRRAVIALLPKKIKTDHIWKIGDQ